MCGVCRDEHCPLALSYRLDCVYCKKNTQNWVKVVFLAFAPITVLYAVISLTKLDITKPHIYAFITYSQILTAPVFMQRSHVMFSSTFHKKLSDVYFTMTSSIYGIWSLDFCRECYSMHLNLNTVQIQMLEYLVVIFPLYLIFLTYIIQKTCQYIFYSCSKTSASSISCLNKKKEEQTPFCDFIDQFTTFFVLSSTKVLSASINLLLPVKIHSLKGNLVSTALYLDGSKEYFGEDHYVTGAMALLITFILLVLPTLTILAHFFKCRRHENSLIVVAHQFEDRFYKHYKDGAGETRDCGYFATFHIVLVTSMQLIYGIVSSPMMFLLGSGVLFLAAFLFAMCKPYKNNCHTKVTFGLFLTLALQHILLFEVDNGTLTAKQVIAVWCFLFIFSWIPLVHCFLALFYLYINPMKYWNTVLGSRRDRLMNPLSNTDIQTSRVTDIE